MKTTLLLRLLLVASLCLASTSSARREKEREKEERKKKEKCLKGLPHPFNSEQRSSFCAEIDSYEPVQCARDGRSGIKLSFNEITELCLNATSSFPVECYKMISNKDRKVYGMALCKGAESSLTWKCWKDITGIKGVTKRIEDKVALEFCTTINDAGPIHCVRDALSTHFSSLSAPQIIDACQYAVEVTAPHDPGAPSQCMQKLKSSVNPSRSVTSSDIVQFCSASVSISAAECFLRATYNASSATAKNSTLRGTVPSALLSLCWDARSANGPVDCLEEANEYLRNNALAGSGPPDWPLQLCSGAPNAGPAKCFAQTEFLRKERGRDGRKLSGKDLVGVRLGLCYGASNAGPAVCLRRAISAFYKVVSPSPRLLDHAGGAIEIPEGMDPSVHYASLLCAEANSDAPGDCAAQAPPWLAAEEIVHLCSGPMPGHLSHDPIKCLEGVMHPRFSKRLTNSPRRCLGYALDSLTREEERFSRAQLIHMCSFHGSQSPLASAQCFRTVPSMLDHDTAVMKLCMNITDTRVEDKREEAKRTKDSSSENWAYDPSALSSCVHLLPSDWSSEDKTLLCTFVNSSAHAEAVVKCALDIHRDAKLLDKPSTALVCREAGRVEDLLHPGSLEVKSSVSKRGAVADCVVKAYKEITSSGSSRVSPDAAVVMEVCSHLSSLEVTGGTCIATFSTRSTENTITSEALKLLCQAPRSLEKLGCLRYMRTHRPSKGSSKAPITTEEVSTCLSTSDEVHSLKVISFESTGDHPRQVMSGKSFSLEMQLFNQWGEKMQGQQGNGVRVIASINANNQQGAVLWGIRSNSSVNGIVVMSSLVISQPGDVELKISTTRDEPMPSASDQNPKTSKPMEKKTLSISKVTVYDNPRMKNSHYCLFVFDEAMCPAVYSKEEVAQWEDTFPKVVGVLSSDQVMMALSCSDIFSTWAVQLFLLPAWSGYMQIQYRYGVDAVWTGHGLPSEEMSFYQRLGLPEGTNKTKLIRRAYHKKSLEWHPDRWSSMISSVAEGEISASLYKLAVQGAFELIAEAYKALMASVGPKQD